MATRERAPLIQPRRESGGVLERRPGLRAVRGPETRRAGGGAGAKRQPAKPARPGCGVRGGAPGRVWASPARLETRTKETNTYASREVANLGAE